MSRLSTWILLTTLTLVGLAVTGVGTAILVTTIHKNRLIANEESVNLVVDLSKRGVYEGTFQQQTIPTHGQQFYLMVAPPFTSKEEAKQLRPFKGRLQIQQADGSSITNHTFDRSSPFLISKSKTWDDWGSTCVGSITVPPNTPVISLDVGAAGHGSRSLTFEVLEGLDIMKGRQQTLIGKPTWCTTKTNGLKWLGGLLIVIGAFILLPTLRAAVKMLRQPSKLTGESP